MRNDRTAYVRHIYAHELRCKYRTLSLLALLSLVFRTRGTRGPRDSKSGTCTATRGRRCGGHKRYGHCALPGEVSDGAIKLAHSKGWDDADGEVSRGHS